MKSSSSSLPSSSSSRPQSQLHVILEHRTPSELEAYLHYLDQKGPVEQLNIFSDFQWFQNGQIIAPTQRQQLFQALQLSMCGSSLKHLHIDLLCDLYLTDAELALEMDYEKEEEDSDIMTDSSSSSTEEESSSSEEEDISSDVPELVQRLQMLPCSLLTGLIQNAPQLESLTLKELFLSGSDQEVQALIQCLETHPSLAKVDLRWKLAGASVRHSRRIVQPLVEAFTRMPRLDRLTLMIPHWCPALERLPLQSSLTTLKLTVEHSTSGSSSSEQPPTHQKLSNLLRQFNTPYSKLKQLELSGFHILQDSTAVLELLTNNTQLEQLVIIDHNVFRRRRGSKKKRKNQQQQASTNNLVLAQELCKVLQSNTALQQLHLISRRGRGSFVRRGEQHSIRQVFGTMMEHNFVLQQVQISHGGIQLSSSSSSKPKKDNFKDCPFLFTKEKHEISTNAGGNTDPLDFYLQLNREGHRRQLFLDHNNNDKDDDDENNNSNNNKWMKAIQQYQKDTPSLFALLQAAPTIVESFRC